MVDTEALQNLEKLNQLMKDGVISEAEFERSKERLLFGGAVAAKASEGDPAADDHIGWMLLPLKRYAQFTGRASRREFWMFQLVPLGAIVGSAVVVAAAGEDEYGDLNGFGSMMLALLVLALVGLVVPQLAVQVRRFHDQNRSGWFAALNLVPYVGPFIVFVMMLLEGTSGDNRFGSDLRAR